MVVLIKLCSFQGIYCVLAGITGLLQVNYEVFTINNPAAKTTSSVPGSKDRSKLLAISR